MFKSILFTICFSLFLTISVSAQTDIFLEKHQERISQNPADVSFTLSIGGNQTKFRQGEVIPLILSFTSPNTGKYTYLNRTYSRGGRLHLDGFVIDKKEQTFDPLYDFFYRKGPKSMGGIFNTPTLSAESQIMNYELNEFMSFKETGKYRLFISSPRVSLNKESKDSLSKIFGGEAVSLVSNVVEFEIVPADKKWQKEKLAKAIKLISESTADSIIRKACKDLRFLGTKEAAKEMILHHSRAEEKCSFQNYIGLYGSPERKFIVDKMEKMLVSPDFAVTRNFFFMLLDLDFFVKNPEHKKTKENIFGFDTKEDKAIKKTLKLQYLEKLLAAIPSKNKKAFLESLTTFFSFKAEGEMHTSAELTNALINNFSKLSKRKQSIILRDSWDKIKNPAMIPILKNIYDSYGNTNLKSTRVTNESFEDYYDKELLNLSIKGVYELDPNIGKPIILNELNRPIQRVHTYILALLPKTDSPEAIDLLLGKLTRSNIPKADLNSVFSLVEHYQTPELISKLRENYAGKIDKLGCDERVTLLEIFLKKDIDFGTELLDKALKNTNENNCSEPILSSVIEPHWSPEIEKIVLVTLENDNLFIYTNAIKLLGKYGSIDVKEKLWKRFEKFNREELNKKDFLEKKDDINNWRIHIAELDFVIALSESPNWWFESELLQKASKLCLYKPCKEKIEELNKLFDTPAKIESTIDEKGQISFSLYQNKNMSLDSLKKKITQFPPESTFKWIPNTKNPNDKKHFLEVKELVEKSRMKLVK